MQKGGLFEMGLLGATQGDPRRWAKNRGTELGVATVTDGGSVEVGNEFDKRLEKCVHGERLRNGDRERSVGRSHRCRGGGAGKEKGGHDTKLANRRGGRQAQ